MRVLFPNFIEIQLKKLLQLAVLTLSVGVNSLSYGSSKDIKASENGEQSHFVEGKKFSLPTSVIIETSEGKNSVFRVELYSVDGCTANTIYLFHNNRPQRPTGEISFYLLPNTLWINRIKNNRRHMCKNIGRTLISLIKKVASELQLQYVRVYSWDHAFGFYHKVGFTKVKAGTKWVNRRYAEGKNEFELILNKPSSPQ